jgi:F-type H+-transporting ATPase subunit O
MAKTRANVKQYGRLLYEVTGASQNEAGLKKNLAGFSAFLAKKGLIGKFEQIIKEFKDYAVKQKGELEVILTTSRALLPSEAKKIDSALEKVLERPIKLIKQTEETILGGFILSFGDKVFDASLRAKLVKLKEKMMS